MNGMDAAHPAGYFFRLLGGSNGGLRDRHLKDWALLYPDSRSPVSPLYDPVCVTALFESINPQDYGVNRAIDKTLRAFT